MTDDERKQAQMYDALKNRSTHYEQRGDKTVEIEQRIPEDDIREELCRGDVAGCWRVCEHPDSLRHVQALKKKLETYPHRVDTDESLITDKRRV